MPYTATSYEVCAEKCVKLANLAINQVVRADILKLRQSYLHSAQRLRATGPVATEDPKPG